MKTTTLNDHLIQLTRYGFVNAYLVREDDGFTLVDTTLSRTGASLIAAASAAGAPIRRIALTMATATTSARSTSSSVRWETMSPY
jgi:glyoxylase-like metal-dependent hydrolase (beta-lactamase superfamily II)